MARATLLVGLVVFLAGQAFAQFESKQPHLPWQQETDAPHFSGDYANFWMDDTLTYTELYFQVPFSRLRFVRNQQIYRAAYEIELYLEDEAGDLVHSRSAQDEIEVANYEETVSRENARASLFTVSLRPGVYHLRAIVTDRETGKSAEVYTELQVRDFSGRALSLSDLQFSSNIELNPSSPDFVKFNRRVEPNVTRVYGQTNSKLFVYYEVYNLAFDAEVDSFQTTITILAEDGQVITQLQKYSRKPGTSCVQSLCLPIADLPGEYALALAHTGRTTERSARRAGTYRLNIEVTDKQTGQRAESSGTFSVYREGFSFQDYSADELIDQLRYIASNKELRKLARMEASQLEQGLKEFWKRKDPTPDTPENELMEEYYRRVRFADRSFKAEGGHGWRAPQGQIYIVFGPPDRIQRILGTFPDPPCEVWEYREINRRFVFAEVGKGTYELLDPISFNDFQRNR